MNHHKGNRNLFQQFKFFLLVCEAKFVVKNITQTADSCPPSGVQISVTGAQFQCKLQKNVLFYLETLESLTVAFGSYMQILNKFQTLFKQLRS